MEQQDLHSPLPPIHHFISFCLGVKSMRKGLPPPKIQGLSCLGIWNLFPVCLHDPSLFLNYNSQGQSALARKQSSGFVSRNV